jgi:hypothetical protein
MPINGYYTNYRFERGDLGYQPIPTIRQRLEMVDLRRSVSGYRVKLSGSADDVDLWSEDLRGV